MTVGAVQNGHYLENLGKSQVHNVIFQIHLLISFAIWGNNLTNCEVSLTTRFYDLNNFALGLSSREDFLGVSYITNYNKRPQVGVNFDP